MKLRLALKLLLSGGRRTISRQILITVSVAIGAALLLAGLASLHLYNRHMAREVWDSAYTAKVQRIDEQQQRPANLLVASRTDFYQGKAIKVVHVAPLNEAAEMHGVPQVPAPNQYYASPELARLLDSAPKDQLGNRFAGLNRAGLIEADQLDSPKQLVMLVGHEPQAMSVFNEVHKISGFYPRSLGTEVGGDVAPALTRAMIVVGISGFLLPIIILIGSSTKIASYRREENLAVLRLIGATVRQTRLLTALDALIGAGIGAVAGLGLYMLVRYAVLGTRTADLPFNYFDFSVPAMLKLLVFIAVPVMAIAVGLLALRRVNISPLGVSRRVKSSSPRPRQAAVLIAGIMLFVGSIILRTQTEGSIIIATAAIGFLLITVGLVMAGPWLLLALSQLMSRKSGSAPLLIASRRMAYDPKTSFRAVAGVVMIVFLGAWLSGASTSMLSPQSDLDPGNLRHVLPVLVNQPRVVTDLSGRQLGYTEISPERAAEIERGLASTYDVKAIKIYSNKNEATDNAQANEPPFNDPQRITGIIACSDLAALEKFGGCSQDQHYKTINVIASSVDHAFDASLTGNLRAEPTDISRHYVHGFFILAEDQATVDKVRTHLVTQVPESVTDYEVKTYGEAVDATEAGIRSARNGFNALVGFVLLIALTSMAIATIGSILERRRSYTTLRLTGADMRELSKTVYFESMLPLIVFTLLAAILGYGSALLLNTTTTPPSGIHPPSSGFLLLLAGGYLVGAGIIWLTLPLLREVSSPTEVRYE